MEKLSVVFSLLYFIGSIFAALIFLGIAWNAFLRLRESKDEAVHRIWIIFLYVSFAVISVLIGIQNFK